MSRIPACNRFHRAVAHVSLQSRLALCIRAAVLGGTFGIATLAPAVLAQSDAAELKTYNVPAGTLDEALNRFARQAGITLSFDPALVQGRKAPALRGNVSVREGLATLLTASDLQALPAADGGYVVQPVARAGETVLRPVSVQGAFEKERAGGPIVGYMAKRSATGTKTDTPLLITPMSVQVISREVMDDQQVLTVSDAVKNVSGVYTRQGPDGNTMDSFNIRGFQVQSYGSTYLDGVRDASRAPKETAGLERIEVLKGPAAIMYGRIEPGGMINRVSKKPQVEQSTKLQQQVGTDNFYRTTVDSTGAITGDNSWLYRVNVAFEDADGFKDNTHNQRVFIAPQVEWRIDDQTMVRAGVEYIDNDRSWALTYGTIGEANGPVDVPISTNLQGKDDKYQDESLSWHLTWSHVFNENWELQQRITYVDRDSVARGSELSAADAQGNYRRTYWGWDDETATIGSTNLDLIGKFATGSVAHTLLAGVDYFDEDYDSGGWATGGTPLNTNIHNPDYYSQPYRADYSAADYWYTNKNLGAYLQDQLSLFDDRLHILAGLRYDSAKATNAYGGNENVADDEKVTWRGGVLYQISPIVSVYTSYVEGFGSSNFGAGGVKFDPQTSKQIEVGAKLQPHPDITVTASAFELIKDNLTMADPDNPNRTILAGEATSKGFELDISGQITPYWNVISSYAYTDVRFTKSDRFQDERLHSVPRNGASLWSTYRFGGSGWQMGAGLVYRSDRLGLQRATNPSLYPYTMDAYTLLDMMVAYDFTFRGVPLKAQVNVNNATDKEYFPSTYGNLNRIAQGNPRTVLGSLSASF